MRKKQLSLIDIQRQYIDAVGAGIRRWGRKREWGHNARIQRGAWNKAKKQLLELGFTEQQSKEIVKDAFDIMTLELDAEE